MRTTQSAVMGAGLLALTLAGLAMQLWQSPRLETITNSQQSRSPEHRERPPTISQPPWQGRGGADGLPWGIALESSKRAAEAEPLPLHLDGALALGDTLSLASADEPAMLPMARAERLLHQRSQDRLAALPPFLRPPLRALLHADGSGLQPGRVVILPIPRLRAPVDLPLVRRASGDVEIYADAMPGAVSESLQQWLGTLEPLQQGQVQPLLIRLEPSPTGNG